MRHIILINGVKGVGKSWVANAIADNMKSSHKVKIKHFAKPLKILISTMLGIKLEELEILKNKPDSKVRRYLQKLGDGVKQVWSNNIFGDYLIQTLSKDYYTSCLIIDDWRFIEEYRVIEEYCKKREIKLTLINIQGVSNTKISDTHISEAPLPMVFDYVLHNNKKDNILPCINKICKEILTLKTKTFKVEVKIGCWNRVLDIIESMDKATVWITRGEKENLLTIVKEGGIVPHKYTINKAITTQIIDTLKGLENVTIK